MPENEKIIVSACLVGEKCRFDGRAKKISNLADYVDGCQVLAICPEVEGGLCVPRPKAFIDSGTGEDVLEGRAEVINEKGEVVTENFIAGARKTLKLALANDVKKAILKSKSPSCGFGWVYNLDKLVKGNGVTAELLLRHGIRVVVI
jgi:uncharacterized protein YbbK (DUF523 family)